MAFSGPTPAANTTALGKDFLLYVNTGTSEATPTWTVIGGLRSNDLNLSADSVDASNKTTGGWKTTLPGLRNFSIDLDTVYQLNDAGVEFLMEAFLAGAQVHVKFERSDKKFYTGWAAITDFKIPTPHDDVVEITGTLDGAGALSDLQTPAGA
nr:MAG TPA: major tail protein [Bacteriophage sp.]